ncbi:hypothetical protein AVEN_88742-1 [Araneus ventricosus]|uniref:Uncharacterized protein n=1 Tax=Araneus ventricosus TaxID=182803 RepID=A0A4Y2PMR3_ARAVE|nr:hypothetical protein AVEN_86349-1 [Araneus ventricosus]GBN52222.1 hypothetical protein AVEN_88742-1 [Araneus ventricosus]
MVNSYRNHNDLARIHPIHLSDTHCESLSAEAEVLMAITSCGPTPPVGGMHYHRKRANRNHYYTHQGTPLTYPAASHPRTPGAPQVFEFDLSSRVNRKIETQ